MKNKIATLSLLAITTLVSCSTYRYTYAPDPANNPTFTEKGESKITANVFSNKIIPLTEHFSNGVNIQAAYSISNHFAATYSYNYKIEKDINSEADGSSIFSYFDSSNTLYKRNSSELGAGSFWFVDEKKEWQFSIYAGYGWGNFSITDRIVDNNNPFTRVFSAKTNKLFLQPAVSLIDKELSLSFVLKASYTKYTSVETNYTNDELSIYRLNNLERRSSMTYEPSLNFQAKLFKSRVLLLNGGAGVSFHGSTKSHRWNFIYAGLGIDPIKLLRSKK